MEVKLRKGEKEKQAKWRRRRPSCFVLLWKGYDLNNCLVTAYKKHFPEKNPEDDWYILRILTHEDGSVHSIVVVSEDHEFANEYECMRLIYQRIKTWGWKETLPETELA